MSWYTVCPKSRLRVLKNCGAQTDLASHMRFAADYSETLEVFFYADGWNERPSLRFSVSCLWNGDCAGKRALCGMAFWDKTQRNYRTQFNKQPPSDYAIRDWQRRFLETGSIHDRKRSGRPDVSDECVETIRASFVRSPTKSTRRKPHVASSICLGATIFQNPEWALCTLYNFLTFILVKMYPHHIACINRCGRQQVFLGAWWKLFCFRFPNSCLLICGPVYALLLSVACIDILW
jgi:hypothetical protein